MTGPMDDRVAEPGDDDVAEDVGEDVGERPRVSPFAERVGPVVAAVGVLGTLAVLVWVIVAPDNVVGSVDEAPFALTATAVTVAEDGDCVVLVAGDGSRTEQCPADAGVGHVHGAWWDVEGRVVLDGARGVAVLDPRTGAVTRPADGEVPEPSGADRPGPGEVHGDGGVVRTGPWDTDGEVVLDLGGPVARLDAAATSPAGDRVVAVDRDGRVLVADPERPASVYVWFETPQDVWFDPWDGIRWEE